VAAQLNRGALGGITLLNTDTHDYHQDEAARDIPRSTVGYSVAEEIPFFLLVFAVPAAVAILLAWRFRGG